MSGEERPERDSSPSGHADESSTSQCDSTAGSNNVATPKLQSSVEEKLTNRMFFYARETICFFLAVVFAALAALHSSPPRVSKPPIARPFFNENSVVLDFYKGHLGALVDRVSEADLSFIMYYAPWDAECQATRIEFENVAKYYHSQIFFAAINCWHPGSECRARYSKIQSYPVLMLYPLRESGIQYKGIRSTAYMMKFLHTVLNPMTRIKNQDELTYLLADFDAVVVGFFDFWGSMRTPGYKEFYRTAIRSLEKYPNGEVAFAVTTSSESDLAIEYGVSSFPSVGLVMWNETLFYPMSNAWTSESLWYWIMTSLHQVVTWLQPPGSKSLTFAPYLLDGPVLFLFTPRNPLLFINYNYNLIREIGLQYYDCAANPRVGQLIFYLMETSMNAEKIQLDVLDRCKKYLEEQSKEELPSDKSESVNDACCSDIPTNKCINCRRPSNQNICLSSRTLTEKCKEIDVFFFEDFSYLEYSEENSEHYLYHTSDNDGNCDSSSSRNKDPQSTNAVYMSYFNNECRRIIVGNDYQAPIYPVYSDQSVEDLSLTSKICRINKTLALIAIDSLHYFHFAESLGIDIFNIKDKTAVVILDPVDESQYIMKEPLGRNSLIRFINDYTEGRLRRSLRTENRQKGDNCPVTTKEYNKTKSTKVCIPELSTETYLKTVLDPTKDVIVMYHSPYCAFCSAVSYVYLTVAHYLSNMHQLKFVRIDGENNDLPWEYSMNRYPSILFFPAKRKEDSTVFPSTLPISVANLLNFVLANLEDDAHVEALVNVCHIGAGEPPAQCVTRIRLLCLDIIEDRLREYQQLNRQQYLLGKKSMSEKYRRTVLLKLALFRNAQLILGSTNDLTKDKEIVQKLVNKFAVYYRTLSNLQS